MTRGGEGSGGEDNPCKNGDPSAVVPSGSAGTRAGLVGGGGLIWLKTKLILYYSW